MPQSASPFMPATMAPDMENLLNLDHLYLELTRLDLWLHQLLNRRQLAMASDAPSSVMTAADVFALLARPFGAPAPDAASVDPTSTATQTPQRAEDASAYHLALAQVDETISALQKTYGTPTRLMQLATRLQLNRFEYDALLIALAPAVDVRYEQIYGYLHGDMTRRYATANLILDLLCAPGPERLLHLTTLGPTANLRRQRLIDTVMEPGLPQPSLLNQALAVDGGLVQWLLGGQLPHPSLAACATLQMLPLLAAAELNAAQHAALDRLSGQGAVLVLHGRDASAQDAAAAHLAALAHQPLLTLNLARLQQENGATLAFGVRTFLRDAWLGNALACITHWDACLADDSAPEELVALIDQHPGPVVMAGRRRWRFADSVHTRPWFELACDGPGYTQRRTLLAQWLDADPLTPSTLSAGDIDALAGRFDLTIGQWRAAIATAQNQAAQEDAALTLDAIGRAARTLSSLCLTTLAHKIEPRYGWDDLILPGDQVERLREIVQMVQGRPVVWDVWNAGAKLAAGRGVAVLFAGPPGTGKTMAAEVIAHALGLDLYRIDLADLVSKFIGETEKNLERIFDDAEHSNAILFFDEADAIFGKRSEVKDAHDRYANIEISYLLQRIEVYNGITVLATNLRANLDDAFTRRMQMIVDFPFPDEAQRVRIWQALLPTHVARSDDLDLELLARRFKLAGGSIRNIILHGLLLAAATQQPLAMPHLLHGARRELQKMGRLADERDFQKATHSEEPHG